MISSSIQRLLDLAQESHHTAKTIIDAGSARFSAAQSYYTMFYLVEALLLSNGLTFSSHSAVVAAYGKVFSKTKLLDPTFHRRIIIMQKRREVGHYGDENEEITNEEAKESFQWAEEFMQAVKEYLASQSR
jgi:uncharacterized protein (UPF0332 family)